MNLRSKSRMLVQGVSYFTQRGYWNRWSLFFIRRWKNEERLILSFAIPKSAHGEPQGDDSFVELETKAVSWNTFEIAGWVKSLRFAYSTLRNQ